MERTNPMSNPRITRFTPTDYGNIRGLFADLAYNVSIDSTLDGATPGTVWADDPTQPHSALIHTVECWALGGEAQNLEAWARFIQQALFSTGEGEELDLRVTLAWEAQIEMLARRIERETVYWPRRHYVCHRLALTDWAARLPEGFSMHPIDAKLLNRV